MINQPDQDVWERETRIPENKLVLPAPVDEGPYQRRYSSPLLDSRTSQQTSVTSPGLFARFFQLVRRDPAYAVLALGIALVIFASCVFLVLGANLMLNGNSSTTWNSAQTQHPSVPTPSGTVDNNPSFPTPATRNGSNQSSQPTAAGPTPVLQPSPSQPTDQGTLTVQITSVPSVVNNNSHVLVGVQTSEPGVTIRLQVTYNATPFFYSSTGQTGSAGDGTLSWNIRVRAAFGNSARATLIVFATDQNGQQATSQPVTVMISGA
jgi:hypothetical protein